MSAEHLYRDAVGAATERLVQLEEDNARLKRELEQLMGRRPRRPGKRSIAPYLMLATMTIAMLSSLAASGGHTGEPRGVDPAPTARISSPCRP